MRTGDYIQFYTVVGSRPFVDSLVAIVLKKGYDYGCSRTIGVSRTFKVRLA